MQDPYVVAKIGQQTEKSAVHKDGGKHPSWKNSLIFRDVNSKSKLSLELFDENLVNDARIGGGWLHDLTKILQNPNEIHKEKVSIFYDGKLCGVLNV